MIGEERPQALKEIIRITRSNGRIGFAEPMCTTNPIPLDITHFDIMKSYKEWLRTINWNCDLFRQNGLEIIEAYYFENAYKLWVDNFKYYDGEKDIILQDNGRWLSSGLIVGQKTDK
ncbi:hypothetical protein MUB24_15210 [Lederbergia sp. NSJ-179]|uniref:hypothetical protein n=1 Tax=Lederbergia sp. NSJ-179 TaxID=2931402 RepID=UPI001FCFA7A2|nr:hypothetical protein [Lederbergia sp. NSJ-179]MCJ7842222.1 hypothetical protein [Lederbergia sp. NSJ-179]